MANDFKVKQAIVAQEVKDLKKSAEKIKNIADANRVSSRIMEIQNENGPTEGLGEVARIVNEWNEWDIKNAINNPAFKDI